MKKKIKKLVLNNIEENPPMLPNYSHARLITGGVILSSNKGIGLTDIFVPYWAIAYIIFE